MFITIYSAQVYALGKRRIEIRDFAYDGAGPDAFFWAGTSGAKPGSVGIILPHPFDGTFFDYEDRSAPILEGRFDKVHDSLTHLVIDSLLIGFLSLNNLLKFLLYLYLLKLCA